MRLVMVIENYFGIIAETAGAPEFVDLEDVIDIRRVVAQKFLGM